MNLERHLAESLDVASARSTNITGGGCINEGRAYELTHKDGKKEMVFVKQNSSVKVLDILFNRFIQFY